ncbi:IS200/IS605 family transposase [Bacteroides sp. OttesenSCG-928-J23]|nr:IS200/IS605 family transposase [Bacteroides sp. OttesenSCG-928-J23]MDL2305677.1 IS200/IS605 family transposase [Bacteroides sp. OttesenSCG-928-D19]
MPYIAIKIHCVWSTKYRNPDLSDDNLRHRLFAHIRKNARNKGIWIDQIGGMPDHVHCLISLTARQSIEEIMQLIKGESSYWYNQQVGSPLQWQNDYFAASVSAQRVDTVRRYIQNQEQHHAHQSFDEELQEFIQLHEQQDAPPPPSSPG